MEYQPAKQTVLIIGAGCNGDGNVLVDLGYDVEFLYDEAYDRYPADWKRGELAWLDAPLLTPQAEHTPDLANFADIVLVPAIHALILENRGPAAIVCGSRGGQVTISRLWRMWKGPSVVLNGGCNPRHAPPEVNLALLCGGRDFFSSRFIATVRRTFAVWPGFVAHCHCPRDSHGCESFPSVIGALLHVVLRGRDGLISHPSLGTAQLWTKSDADSEWRSVAPQQSRPAKRPAGDDRCAREEAAHLRSDRVLELRRREEQLLALARLNSSGLDLNK